ncbi:ABC-type branched-chain amino acid transport system, substrate-binding protein [Parafrankia irregularis]|uniref:ABC-type branched-chain amino acid transport system, substrate-binding protein n=1 Tax=Parafrankia irregularis TaxID=795642 RepID=A0A0S4QM40_9ACTN|nr:MULTISPECIES: ABC transporter substrate-binding protein [Parafrankia]CUU56611.1 ABC-type branched-chain amino acid transport system, substrate-binding protein [Parafrankia irregularis]
MGVSRLVVMLAAAKELRAGTRRRSSPWRRKAVTSAVAVGLLAGCSAGKGDAGRIASCEAPGVTPESIKVGLIYPDTGGLADAFRPARSAVEARIGLANATGGVNGREIELVWRDDSDAPAVNARVAKDLVEKERALGLVQLSAAVSGSADYLDQAGVPVTGLTAESLWNDHDNMFSFSYVSAKGAAVTTFGRYARAQGGTRAVVLQQEDPGSSTEIADQLIVSLGSQYIETVGRVGFTTGISSATRTADQIIASKADIIVSTVSMDSLAEVLEAVRVRGGKPRVIISPTGYNARLLQEKGAALAGLSIWLNYTPFESRSPAIGQYENAMALYGPGLETPDQEVAVASYISADLFLRGLQAAGPCPTRESFITNLRAVKDYDAGGLVPGTIDLSTNRGSVSTCYAFVRVNANATGFDVMHDGDGSSQWCGTRLQPTGR